MWRIFIVTFSVAVLSGLGVGSAGLLVVWLTLIEGAPQLLAQGLNLIFFILSSGTALIVHLFRTPLLWGCVILLIPFGIIGCFTGTALATVLPQALLRRIFGAMLIVSGAMGIFTQQKSVTKA